MKLNNSDRQAFVLAVMNDVPSIDYDEIMRKTLTAFAVKQMPADLRKMYKQYPDYFTTRYWKVPRFSGIYVPRGDTELKATPELEAEIARLDNLKSEQSSRENTLRAQLQGAIGGCSTLKQAHERLPEFIKYMPHDRDGTGAFNLPVVANMVANLTAAGWPKGKVDDKAMAVAKATAEAEFAQGIQS